MEKKEGIKTLEQFLKSKEYLDLKKEIADSVKIELQNPERGGDIEPLTRLLDSELEGYNISAVQKERLFWDMVADSLKESVFETIYKKIYKLIEDGQNEAAEQTINKDLADIIKQLSPTIHRKLDKRGPALIELKNKFFEFLPEVGVLIMGAKEGKKLLTKVPGGKFMEQEEKERGDKKKPPEHPRFVKERTWEVPALEEIKPGLVVEYKNIKLGSKSQFIVRSFPGKDTSGGLFIMADESEPLLRHKVFLADKGIVPSYKTGLWNGWYRPTKWYMEENITK